MTKKISGPALIAFLAFALFATANASAGGSLGVVITGQITHVADGDTVEVETVKVRLLGVNTPETVKPNSPVECEGPEASAYVHALLGRWATARSEASSGDVTDRYGRVLAYVSVRDLGDLGLHLVRAGLGRVYQYRGRPFGKLAAYSKAEATARKYKRGGWGACGWT